MMALFVWWFALPAIARRLMGAVLVCGIVAGAILVYGSHRESKGYHNGAVHVTDSVSAVAIKRISAAETVYVHDAVRADSQVVAVSHGHPVQHLVIQPQPVPLVRDSVQPELTVRVIVEAVHDTVDNVPLRAAHYWQRADSVAGLAIKAAGYWHSAYLASDSLSALWRTRALANIAPVSASHAKRDAVFATIGATVALIARNQIHR